MKEGIKIGKRGAGWVILRLLLLIIILAMPQIYKAYFPLWLKCLAIDGTIKEDKLGLDAIYIQAKRWDRPVGRPIVQAFAGSLGGHRARKGVLITTSQFSQDARDYVNKIEKRIVLIDGEELAQLMMDHGKGLTKEAATSFRN